MSESWIQLTYDLDCRLSDGFAGPLDLLLHLVRRHSLDLRKLPLAELTEKYLEELERYQRYNIDVASEFLVLAATLVEWKCRFVLPAPETPLKDETSEQTEVRSFFERLMELDRVRRAGAWLDEHLLIDRVLYRRGWAEPFADVAPEVLISHHASTLLAAWRKLEQRIQRFSTLRSATQRSLRVHQAQVLQVLMEKTTLSFSRLLAEHFEETPAMVVVTFLALLELVRSGIIRLTQFTASDDILISLQTDWENHATARNTLPTAS